MLIGLCAEEAGDYLHECTKNGTSDDLCKAMAASTAQYAIKSQGY